jgi:hypothetical protein
MIDRFSTINFWGFSLQNLAKIQPQKNLLQKKVKKHAKFWRKQKNKIWEILQHNFQRFNTIFSSPVLKSLDSFLQAICQLMLSCIWDHCRQCYSRNS